VGYDIEFVDSVLEYLQLVDGLTEDDRKAILAGMIEKLSQHADRFLTLRPLAHESFYCRYDYPYLTHQSIYNFDFIVDAQFMPVGVLRVVYVECTSKQHGN
jgi:hypothetical protein